MPVFVAAGGLGCEQKVHLGFTLTARDSQGPVLIISSKAWQIGASLADDISRLAVTDVRRTHPGFERNGITVLKIKIAVRPRIGNRQIGSGVDAHRRIVRRHIGKLWRTGTGLVASHVAVHVQRHGLLAAEIPAHGPLGCSCDRDRQ